MYKMFLAMVLVAAATGCVSPSAAYVSADRATLNAVAPEYLKYVAADISLDAAQKARRTDLIASWQHRVEEAEKK